MCGSPFGGWLADYVQIRRPGGRIAVQAGALFVAHRSCSFAAGHNQ
jgi:hypothetical protein